MSFARFYAGLLMGCLLAAAVIDVSTRIYWRFQ